MTALHWLLLLAALPPIHSQGSDLWWCGTTHADAAATCSQPCPSGIGCPLGTVCFSGVTGCVVATGNSNSAASTGGKYCGSNLDQANRCETPCPTGSAGECPPGQACFAKTSCGASSSGLEIGSVGIIDSILQDEGQGGIPSFGFPSSSLTSSSSSSSTSSLSASSSSSNSLLGLTGIAAVEETFVQMKDAINNDLFLYETPMQQWIPSTVYRFDGFFDGLKIMHQQGVAGQKIYLGGDCDWCHMYGLVNVAAFLAQAMKETIRYDACDENSWDRVGPEEMYPISNACGQLGQSYQDYHCSEEERHMECEVDPQMTITAVTNAKWWGAPGPLKCGPKSMFPQTGYWDFNHVCDDKWANPPQTCDAYEGQQGGGAMNDLPYANAAGRTDVEGCCWWGRGVIQTSGVCNFGKLNYFLGKRAADEGRESRYPNIDFCRDPEAICSSKEHQELKWIAGFFYWINEVQEYDDGGWNYIDELHKYVDGGLQGDGFINAVSGIVNRGCHDPPCGTGELDGGPERAKNFLDIIKEMRFSFVDVPAQVVVPQVVPQPAPQPTTNRPVPELIFPGPVSPPTPSTLIAETPPTADYGPTEYRYSCGEYQFDATDTSIPPSAEVSFDYEMHNGIDVTVGDALRDIKQSILSDIANRLGCFKTSGRRLRSLSDEFESIISLQSNANDLPDPDAAGCMVDVETLDPTTCTPVSGSFTFFARPGTSESSLQEITDSLKEIVRTSMALGRYETATVVKAIYIGDRTNFSNSQPAPINAQSEGEQSIEGWKIAVYALAGACLVLICLLWFAIWTYREKVRGNQRKHDEEMAFNKFMLEEREDSSRGASMMAPQPGNYMAHSQRMPPQSQRHFQSNGGVSSRGKSMNTRYSHPDTSPESAHDSESASHSSESSDGFVEDVTPIPAPRKQSARSKSASRVQANSRRRSSQSSRRASSDGGSVSDDSGSSSDEDGFDVAEQKVPVQPRTRASMNGPNTPSRRASSGMMSTRYNSRSLPVLPGDSAREERQKRMAAARARASKRQSAMT